MNKLTSFLLSFAVLFVSVACSDVAKTSSDAPNNPNETVTEPENIEETAEDANTEVRQKQIESDTRARDERNEALGDGEVKDDDDLASQVRSELETSIPGSKLSVKVEDSLVTIFGTVPEQQDYESIEPLAKEVEGVKTVKLDVQVVPPNSPESE
ncbi:BON domain-containing protein [Oscillatoria salina]|uniref:BON domain-containing protein n=1 Tax=Oscillatoria salina TaxID=331517 RepID=UPI0013BAC7F4|nr:BON domain-containing protein [Oscillatoria salina]MBZ8182319.1 BON domain-containing protein [Oscillatoria salina IIICB1]NET89970.1 BON domain-containing protein [Kamptonema sp. SIO1D9]